MRWAVPAAGAFLLALLLAAFLCVTAQDEMAAAPGAPGPERQTIRITRIEPSRAPEAESARAQTPVAEPAAPLVEPPLPSTQTDATRGPTRGAPVSDTQAESGRRWLASGAFPELRATYRRIGFSAYRDAMRALGARFFLYDAARRRLVAEVNPHTGERIEGPARAGLSPWPRDVTRHLSDVAAAAKAGAARVVLLPPVAVDAALLGSVDAHLRALALDPTRVRRLDLAYEMRADRLGCSVLTVAFDDGSERALALQVDLSAIGVGGDA